MKTKARRLKAQPPETYYLALPIKRKDIEAYGSPPVYIEEGSEPAHPTQEALDDLKIAMMKTQSLVDGLGCKDMDDWFGELDGVIDEIEKLLCNEDDDQIDSTHDLDMKNEAECLEDILGSPPELIATDWFSEWEEGLEADDLKVFEVLVKSLQSWIDLTAHYGWTVYYEVLGSGSGTLRSEARNRFVRFDAKTLVIT